MSDTIRVLSVDRKAAPDLFPAHTGEVMIQELAGQTNEFSVLRIWAATPTAANFNAAPLGSILYDTDDYTAVLIKTAATVWSAITIV